MAKLLAPRWSQPHIGLSSQPGAEVWHLFRRRGDDVRAIRLININARAQTLGAFYPPPPHADTCGMWDTLDHAVEEAQSVTEWGVDFPNKYFRTVALPSYETNQDALDLVPPAKAMTDAQQPSRPPVVRFFLNPCSWGRGWEEELCVRAVS